MELDMKKIHIVNKEYSLTLGTCFKSMRKPSDYIIYSCASFASCNVDWLMEKCP